MITYQSLTQDQSVALAHERVAHLEAEHFRMRLLLSEAIDAADIAAIERTLLDLERRHAIHTIPPAEQGHGHGHGHGHDHGEKGGTAGETGEGPADPPPGTEQLVGTPSVIDGELAAADPVAVNGTRPE